MLIESFFGWVAFYRSQCTVIYLVNPLVNNYRYCKNTRRVNHALGVATVILQIIVSLCD